MLDHVAERYLEEARQHTSTRLGLLVGLGAVSARHSHHAGHIVIVFDCAILHIYLFPIGRDKG